MPGLAAVCASQTQFAGLPSDLLKVRPCDGSAACKTVGGLAWPEPALLTNVFAPRAKLPHGLRKGAVRRGPSRPWRSALWTPCSWVRTVQAWGWSSIRWPVMSGTRHCFLLSIDGALTPFYFVGKRGENEELFTFRPHLMSLCLGTLPACWWFLSQ